MSAIHKALKYLLEHSDGDASDARLHIAAIEAEEAEDAAWHPEIPEHMKTPLKEQP